MVIKGKVLKFRADFCVFFFLKGPTLKPPVLGVFQIRHGSGSQSNHPVLITFTKTEPRNNFCNEGKVKNKIPLPFAPSTFDQK